MLIRDKLDFKTQDIARMQRHITVYQFIKKT